MLQTLESVPLKGRRVLLRLDLNVPIDETGKVSDETRIQEAVPTVRFLLEQGAHIVLVSHLGRPKGVTPSLSLRPLLPYLERAFSVAVRLWDDSWDTLKIESDSIVLLENIRFFAEEEANDADFSRRLASLADVYVNDAFGTLHRAHASTEGVTHFLPSYAGFLVQKEVEVLSRVLEAPEHPFALLVGGAKVDTKIGILEHFLELADHFLIGGALSTTFLASQGFSVGASLYEPDELETAQRFLAAAARSGAQIHLPVDLIVAHEVAPTAPTRTIAPHEVSPNDKILDIGPQTQALFSEVISQMKTIVWNGPMGLYEMPPFASGTKSVAKAVAESSGLTVLGGGDTVDAVHHFNMNEQDYSHISTGGGAMLEFLEGKSLPALLRLMR